MLRIHGFVHEQRTAEVTATLVGDARVECRDFFPVFFLACGGEDGADFGFGGCGDADEEGSRSNGCDDAGS